MITAILLFLVIFWLMGYGPFQALHIVLFKFMGISVNLWDILILIVFMWLVGSLQGPFRQIAVVFVLIWVLSLIGVIAIAGFSNILLIAIIVGVLLYVISGAGN